MSEPSKRRLGPLVRKASAVNAQRLVSAEPLQVAPAFIGARLASPTRRAAAMALDLLAIALLTGIGGLWLVAGIGVVLLQLATRRGGVPRSRFMLLGWAAAALVLWLGLSEVQQRWFSGDERRATSVQAVPDDDDEVARPGVGTAVGATAPAVPASGASRAPDTAAARIAELEAALDKASQKPKGLLAHLRSWLDDIGAGLGWGIVYFSLLPAWWQGQTLGKKLLRLRVVELAGQPVTVMRSLKRYGGYAAGLATGGIGLAQLLWDPNRQALHDKAAHTVVLDERPLPLPTPKPTPTAEPPAEP